MSGRLRQLSADISHRVRSHTSLTSLAAAVDAALANSVDSGATQVLVVLNIETMSFTVLDNGCGIRPEDISSVGERHWTTKLHDLEQLERLSTRGFRGEGLSSIAAMSCMTIKSKTASFNGTYMTRIHNGERTLKCVKVENERLSSCGTEIHVEQMFFNTPVRLKHLRQEPVSKTIQMIRTIVVDYAISYPAMRLTVRRQQGDNIASLCCVNAPKTRRSIGKKWAEVFEQVYGIQLGSSYRYASQVSADMKIQLFISSIPLQTKAYQFTFINQRMTDSKLKELVNQELSTEAYDNKSMSNSPKKTKKSATSVGTAYNKCAAFILHVEHKRAIRNLENGCAALPDNEEVLRRVKEIAIQLKGEYGGSPHEAVETKSKDTSSSDRQVRSADTSLSVAHFAANSPIKIGTIRTREIEGMIADKGSRENGEGIASTIEHLPKRRKFVKSLPQYIHDHDHSDDRFNDETEDEMKAHSEEKIPKELLSSCSVISQVDDKFILIKSNTSSKLYIVDQHACDERIQVEELYKDAIQRATDGKRTLGNPLVEKITTTASKTTLELLNMYKDQLDHWGIKFIIKPSNNSSNVTFTHLPEVMHTKATNDSSFVISSIIQFLHDLNDKNKLSTIPKDWHLGVQAMPTILILLLNNKACRSAIMFGHKLSKLECELMMSKLSECKQPFQCAHGRPSIVPLCDISLLYIEDKQKSRKGELMK